MNDDDRQTDHTPAYEQIREAMERRAAATGREGLIERLAANVHHLTASRVFPYEVLTTYIQQPYRDIAERRFLPLIVEFVAEWLAKQVDLEDQDLWNGSLIERWRKEMQP